jgi:hypothetical protein
MTHTVKLTGSGLPGGTTIEVDGAQIQNVTAAINIDPARGLPVVTIRLVPALYLGLDVDPAQITLDDDTRHVLSLLGWVPLQHADTGAGYSTPARYADCDEVVDSRGKTWRYSQPGDVWRLLQDDGLRMASHSARSYQRLLAEFGPLTDGSR